MKQLTFIEAPPDRVELSTRQPVGVVKELARREKAADRILERLKIGPATNYQLCVPEIGGLRACGARIPELREEGYDIKAEHVKGGTWLYTLVNR